MKNIPIDEIQNIGLTNSSNVVNAMKKVGINTLSDLISTAMDSLIGQQGVGSAKIAKWKEIQKSVYDNKDQIANDYLNKNCIHIVPVSFYYEKGLTYAFKSAIKELISIIESSKNAQTNRCFPYLFPYFIENKDVRTIAEEYNISNETVRMPLVDFYTRFCTGEIVFGNIQLNEGIVNWFNSLKDNRYKFHLIDELTTIAGSHDDLLLKTLGYDTIDFMGLNLIIPCNTRGTYSRVLNALDKVLQKSFLYLNLNEILQRVETLIAEENPQLEYEDDFIEAILANTHIIDNNEFGIRIKLEYIRFKEDRCARIVYDAGRGMTRADIEKTYENIYNEKISFVYSKSLTNKGFTTGGGRQWMYGNDIKPLEEFINEYAEEKIIFHYEDIIEAISDYGYSINDATVRTYITNLCNVDNSTRSIFCIKEKCEEHPDYNWRKTGREGLSNWVLNQAKDIIISSNGHIGISELYDKIVELSKNTEFNSRIKERARTVINSYIGDGLPFVIKDDELTLDETVYENTDWDVIGHKGGRFPFFAQIRDIAANTIKHRREDRIPLMDFVGIIQTLIDEKQVDFPNDRSKLRKLIIDAIENKKLTAIPVKLESVDNTVYLVKIDENSSLEPLYKVKEVVKDGITTPEIEETPQHANSCRENITYKTVYNWEQLVEQFTTEFTFYSYWLNESGLQLTDSINLFRGFMENAKNSNLREMLPQNLYEYFYANTALYDRKTYVRNLALSYEGLLKEIYIRNNNEIDFKTRGLGDWFCRFPELSYAMSIPHREAKKFSKILHDLYYKRNVFAHGEDLTMSSKDIATAITEYTILYIYTVAKFYRN